MGAFVCKTCGAQSDQASECHACGCRTFELSPDAVAAAESALGHRREPRGQLISITDAPSLRRRRRLAAS